jgi:flavin-dependent dehydrogenase
VTPDVVVIGAGPAGLAVAIAARARGLSCLVLERRSPPIDKACGEGLMPDALRALHRLGVAVEPNAGARFRGIRFTDGRASVEASFPDGFGLGVRRPQLHRLLVERAEDIGVGIQWNARVEPVDGHTVRVDDAAVHCRWLIGADGAQSSVRRWAGLHRLRRDEVRFGARRHYHLPPWSDLVEVHWGARGQFYVTPVGREEVCVALLTRWRGYAPETALADFPWLADRLSRALSTSHPRSGLSATRTLRRVVSGSVALVGDASGSADAITGEGMALAFREALALAAALEHGTLDAYEGAHRAIVRRPRRMARLMLTMDRWPSFRRRALPALARMPEVFAEFLALHVGHAPRARVLVPGGLKLGWQVLTEPVHGQTVL